MSHVDLKPLISTFVLLLIAELGDKTQLAVISQAAQFKRPWMVLLGACLALSVVSGIGVAIGQAAGAYLPRDAIRWVAGALFIIMGALIMLKVF